MELRPRKTRPSLAYEENFADEVSSSDEFEPGNERGEDNGELVGLKAPLILPEGSAKSPGASTKGAHTKADTQNISAGTRLQHASHGKGLPRPKSHPPLAQLATPVPDHRHRSGPLYWRPAHVERLAQRPELFKPPVVVSTNSWNTHKSISERFSKAYGQSVGAGPVWNFLEDRSWWKESLEVNTGDTETEAVRRPRVYTEIALEKELCILNHEDSGQYIPSGKAGELELKDSPTIKCYFGPFEKQTLRELKPFESFPLSDYINDSTAYAIYAGGPVWGLDWCPVYVEDRRYRSFKQYLAIAPLPSHSHTPYVGIKCSTPSPACIQIWSAGPSDQLKADEACSDDGRAIRKMKCEVILGIDCGPALELKWCPLPSNDGWLGNNPNKVRKLGILAGVFEDGSLSLFVVPDPEDIRAPFKEDCPVVKVQPVLRIGLDETSLCTLDWANSELIAAGCSNGSVAVYNVKEALMADRSSGIDPISPSYFISVHQSAVRSIQWVREPRASADGLWKRDKDPCIIASGGYDGCESLIDVREGDSSIVNRTRDVPLTMCYTPFATGIITVDLENVVKSFSVSPVMLGRGHLLLEAGGPIWNVHVSDYHPNVAIGSAEGAVLTTNLLRSTRRSATAPFLYYRVYQMDYNRKTREYRMLEQFLPQEVPDKSSAGKRKNREEDVSLPNTGAWPEQVSITRVVWNSGGGLSCAPLLASATAAGLCRIDWLEGTFIRSRIPYGGIEYIREEVHTEGTALDDEDD